MYILKVNILFLTIFFYYYSLSNSLDKELCDTEYEEDLTPNKSIDQKILGLASKLSGCEAAQNHSFDKWLPSDSRSIDTLTLLPYHYFQFLLTGVFILEPIGIPKMSTSLLQTYYLQ